MTDILQGVDASSWQGSAVDWEAVAGSGISFAFVKCSEGSAYKDPTYDRNWAAIHAAGLVAGAYHFARPHARSKPQDEAAWFVRCLGPLAAGDSAILDVEEGDANDRLADWALAWLQAVETALGFKPLVYTYLSFAQSYLQRQELAAYPLWLSLFDAACPRSVPPWPEVAIHQFTDGGVVPGIGGAVDLSRCARTRDGLRALGKPAPAPPPAEEPPAAQWAIMTTDQWLRAQPDAGSRRLADLPVGTVLPVIGPPTTHWAHVRAPSGQAGWILVANCALSVQRPAPS